MGKRKARVAGRKGRRDDEVLRREASDHKRKEMKGILIEIIFVFDYENFKKLTIFIMKGVDIMK